MSVTVPCTRCKHGTWTRSDGARFRCAYCTGTGRVTPEARSRRAGLTAEQQLDIAERYQRRGASLRSVAAETFVHKSTVASVLAELGVPLRPHGGSAPTLSNEQLLEAGELYALGWTMAEIAEVQGVHRSTVRYRLRRLQAKWRPRSESARIGWTHRKEAVAP